MAKAKNLGEFKINLGEQLQGIEKLLGSEKIKKQYRSALFREIVSDPEYQQLKNEYLNEKISEKSKENPFQEAFSRAQKLNPSLTEEDFKSFSMEKPDNEESKETLTKSLEFAEDTFRIDSQGWEEVTEESAKKNPNLKKFLDKGIRIKANATGDVVEHMEDTVKGDLKCKKGEQLFIFDYRVAWERERFFGYIAKAKGCSIQDVQNKYFLTKDQFEEKMKDKPRYSEEYKNFFNKEINGHLAGSWTPAFAEKFYNVGEVSSIWLDGDYRGTFSENGWGRDNNNHGRGLSVRLLKN